MKETLISKDFFKDGCNRSDSYMELFKTNVNGKESTVKIYINSDTQYPNYIAVFDLNSLEWKNVFSIPRALLNLPMFPTQQEFLKVADELKKKFYNIIG